MALNKKIKDLPVIVQVIFLLLGIVILYKLVIFLTKAFVYLGFNLFLVTDNLVKFESANPVILWGLLGLFIGSIFGVLIAIKKFKLSKVLILYPLSVTILAILILSFINKPGNVTGIFAPAKIEEPSRPSAPINKNPVYIVTRTIYIRSAPSLASSKLFTLSKGAQVQVIESVRDKRNNIWSEIEYIDPQTGYKKTGYVNANYLK